MQSCSEALGSSPVERSTHANAHAEHDQFASWAGIVSHGFQTIPSAGGSATSKGGSRSAIVLLYPVVDRIACERPRDLVALIQDDELLVRTSLVGIVSNCLRHTGTNAVVGHVGGVPTISSPDK